MTTGGFDSAGLLLAEQLLALPALDLAGAVEIGEIAVGIGRERGHGIAVEVRMGEWTVFHVSLAGSTADNDSWIARKARVVALTGHSTMYERVLAEEQGTEWYSDHGVSESEYAIHGGGLPLHVTGTGHVGTLLISGLPQVEDHLLGIEVLTEYLARKGEEQI